MEKSLVSIVTPCYNTGSYIHRLMDSILQQTYPNIEMFVIDDGSTDDSADVVKSYIPKFQSRGYTLKLVSQRNSGQSVAIREGMKLIQGKYFIWPDSDDFYASASAIEKMVETFERLDDSYGLVRSQLNLVEDGSLKVIKCSGRNAKAECDRLLLFEDCLFCRNGFFFPPGAYMADFQKLKKSTTLDIYTDKDAGQNWQLMLPLLYNYKCFTIREPLYNVVRRQNSHSRGQYAGYDMLNVRINSFEKVLLETLQRIYGMPETEKNKYAAEVRKKYCRERIIHSFYCRVKTDFDQFYEEGVEMKCIGFSEKLMKVFFSLPLVVRGFLFIKRHIL